MSDCPAQVARAQRLMEGRAQAVAGIGQHRAEAQPRRAQAFDLLDGDLGLCPCSLELRRNANALHPLGIGDPAVGQEQPQSHHHANLAGG
jgi:hypothetical protein